MDDVNRMTSTSYSHTSPMWRLRYCLFAGVAMCYGWGWRGVYGHEAGAMLPGGLVALAICLASHRPDWYRRSLVAGMAGAIGWAWGGQISNMEHRAYILSDSLLDVTYGFACIGLLGALWSGIGGATLALALTRRRSELNRFMGPLVVQAVGLIVAYLVLANYPHVRRAYFEFTERFLHDSKWLPVTITIISLSPYWLLRKKDRPASGLMILCGCGWWIGYLTLTKIGGLELAPPSRSESWGGVLGILVVLLVHHVRRRDRAALMLTQYAMLAGCLGFIVAMQIHVPFIEDWWPFASVAPWKFTEESFGFLMGFGVALGAVKLLRGGLTAVEEDSEREPLDLFAAFVLLVAMFWMNLRDNVSQWQDRYHVLPDAPLAPFQPPFPQLEAWQWFFIAGLFWTGIVLDALRRYHLRQLAMVPRTAFEKGAMVFAIVLAISLAATIARRVPAFKEPSAMFSAWTYLMLAGAALWMLLARSREGMTAKEMSNSGTPANSAQWTVGWKYWCLWAWVPVHVILAGQLACYLVDEPFGQMGGGPRYRFGERASWRVEQEQQIQTNLPP